MLAPARGHATTFVVLLNIHVNYYLCRFKRLPEYASELRSEGIRLIPLFDPFIYERMFPWETRDLAERTGDKYDVWAKRPSGRDATGGGWFLYNAKFPDYTNPVAKVESV